MRLRQFGGEITTIGMCLYAGVCLGAVGSSYQDWQFNDAASVAPPTVATNAAGTGTATIVLGYLAAGWLADLTGFGTRMGLWDLGAQNPGDPTRDSRGRVELSVPNPGSTSVIRHTDLALRVVQFVDGFMYTGDLLFSLPGAAYSGRTIIEALPGPLGGNWVEDEFRWRLEPSPAQMFLTITGAVNGSLLDRLRVETQGSAPEPLPLRILSVRQQGETMVIDWEGGVAPYQVYETSDLLSGEPWQPLGAPTSATTATLPLSGPVGFVRVRGSE